MRSGRINIRFSLHCNYRKRNGGTSLGRHQNRGPLQYDKLDSWIRAHEVIVFLFCLWSNCSNMDYEQYKRELNWQGSGD